MSTPATSPTTRTKRPAHPVMATHARWATWGLTLASALVWLPAHAASTSITTSSASSASVGSSSDSLGASSDSASPKQRVAQGTYTVVAMVEVANATTVAGAPLRVQLHLQATHAAKPTNATQAATTPRPAQAQNQTQTPAATVAQGTSGAPTTDAPTTEWVLTLPRDTVARVQLQLGQQLRVAHRPYGLALSLPSPHAAGPQPPFFLVLDDTWHRELDSQAVGS